MFSKTLKKITSGCSKSVSDGWAGGKERDTVCLGN